MRISWNQCENCARAHLAHRFSVLDISKMSLVQSIPSDSTNCMKSACSLTFCRNESGAEVTIEMGVSVSLVFAVVVVSILMKIRSFLVVHANVGNVPGVG